MEQERHNDCMFRGWRGARPHLLTLAARGDAEMMRRRCWQITLSTLRKVDSEGLTALHMAALHNNAETLGVLLQAISQRVQRIRYRTERKAKKTTMRFLMRHDVNIACYMGQTPLYVAMSESAFACAELLLDYGARPGISRETNQEDELSMLMMHCVCQIQAHGRVPDNAIRMLHRLRRLRMRPDVLVRDAVTPLVTLVVEAIERRVSETDAVADLVQLVLRKWKTKLRSDDILLRAAQKSPRLFRLLWQHYEKRGLLAYETVNSQVGDDETLLMGALLESDEETVMMILEGHGDPLLWQYARDPEVPDPPEQEALSEREDGCVDEEEPQEMEVDGDEEEVVADSFRPAAGMLCPLAVAMRRQMTAVVERMLEKTPGVWRAQWAHLVECCRRSRSTAWLARAVCRRTRMRGGVRMQPLDRALADEGFAPPTTMDITLHEMLSARGRDASLPLSPAFMRRHQQLLFRSAGRDERRPSWALRDVLTRCSLRQAEAVAPLLTLLDRRPPLEASTEIFQACLHSRLLLLAAVSRGARPDVDLSRGDSPVLQHLVRAVRGSESPRCAWAVVAIVLGCHPTLLQVAPESQQPFPLLWTALGAVRAKMEGMGFWMEEEMEAYLKRVVAPVAVDLILLRDLSMVLPGRTPAWLRANPVS